MKVTVLVVEDNPDNMTLVEEILEDAGYDILKAERAEDGIELLKRGGIDIVLMDISLPDMDGLEATRIIKADAVTCKVPVVGLSAHAMESDRQAALDAGCDEYETKPIDEDALLETIKKVIKAR